MGWHAIKINQFIIIMTSYILKSSQSNQCSIAMIQLYKYTDTCRNIINNNDERTHLFRKIFFSHFIRNGCERVVCERRVWDLTDYSILTPSSFVFSSTFFSFCWAAQPGILRAQALCWELVLTASNCISNFNWLTPTNSNCLWHRVI